MFIADFHIHSKYSRATSKDCVPEMLEFWARRKGIGLIGTGDFTHPAWREELQTKLVPSGEGLYSLKDDFRCADQIAGEFLKPQFIVTGEISSIYKKNGKVRKVHNLIILPSLEHAELVSRRLEAIGNIGSDGRPILGLDSRDLLEIVLDTCAEAIFIPAHIWTPHFSLYGAYSGFDHIEECFEDLTGCIYALETGLSSDPPMNWRLSALDGFTLVSNSDAHSPAKLGREANIFDTPPSYQNILRALKNRHSSEFYGTIEFFPEEGKYHYDGHRKCKVCWKPADTREAQGICPVCGGRITVGVLHRVEALADREEGFVPPQARHFESLVPLPEIIASSIGVGPASKRVGETYRNLLENLGPELFILREATLSDIEQVAGSWLAEGIRRLRCGEVRVQPGFDGEYGKITVMDKSEVERLSGQLYFFGDIGGIPSDPPTAPTPSAKGASPSQDVPAPVAAADRPRGGGAKIKDTVAAEIPYDLNREQWEAVSSSSPAIAVIAGPGTGKTKTLVCRAAYLVEKCGVRPARITAVTFTNKAAREMRVRLEKRLGKRRTAAMTIGTFHSISLRILARARGGSGIVIIDEYNALAIIEEIIKEMQLEISPRDALRGISLLKNGLAVTEKKRSGLEKGTDLERRPGSGGLTAVPAPLYDAYCARLKRYGVMDYDDILLETLRGFEGGDNFSYLLVDEFQDINEIQYRLVKAWGRESKSIFIIGDPDQSIYGFRGSDPRYGARFAEDFPDIRQFRLTRNYRSTPEIILCARSLLSPKDAGSPERILEASRAGGLKIRLLENRDEFSEAIFVAKEINRMVGGIDMLDTQALAASRRKKAGAGPYRSFSDIALLYRTNQQARVLEQCLIKEGIPYVVAGREDFLADGPVRRALAFFRFLLNPRDMASLLLCLPGERDDLIALKAKILASYAAGEKTLASLSRIMEGNWPSPEQPHQDDSFAEMLNKYAALLHKEKPGKIIDEWIDDHNLSDRQSMALLSHTAVMYDDMPALLQNLILGRESDVVRSGGKAYSPEAVSLMTIHAAKGLEFPIVFICGVNDGLIPLRSSRADVNMDEERRLLYVGMTRARDELLLLTSGIPSPFAGDLAEEQLSREQAAAKPKPQYQQAALFD